MQMSLQLELEFSKLKLEFYSNKPHAAGKKNTIKAYKGQVMHVTFSYC